MLLLYVLRQSLSTKLLLNMIVQQSYARKATLGLDQFHKIANGVILIIIMTFRYSKGRKGGGAFFLLNTERLHAPVPFKKAL